MLYFNFKNYEEFKEVFGKRVANNGKKVRSNHILLSFLKHEFKCKRFKNLRLMSISMMESVLLNEVAFKVDSVCLANGTYVYSKDFNIDDRRGVCEDGDTKCVRYVRKDNNRVYKMKAGKFMRNVLESCGAVEKYCEQAIIYVCERFAEKWSAYVESNYGDGLTLHVDEDFCRIYNDYECKGDFHSCMSGEDQYYFYEEAVKAKAAYLTNDDDKIVARCVIFTEVHDNDTGEVFRLAERQYATDQDNSLKQILVNKLIAAKEIDGYKQIGVDCHKSMNFVLNDGTSLSDRHLWIRCNLDYEDTLSYQDSFKWYDMASRRADNYGYGFHDLATTDREFQGYAEWDSYHGRYCESVEIVNTYNSYFGRFVEETCDSDDLIDFGWCARYGEYYDRCEYSRYEDDCIPEGEYVFSEFLDDYLWSDHASWCEEAQDYLPDTDYDYYFGKWKEENWEYDEYNQEYVEEVIPCEIWNDNWGDYETKAVEKSYAEQNFYLYNGEWYSEVSESGIPYLVEQLEECECV